MKIRHPGLAGLACAAIWNTAAAQGHSALRDPERAVFASFPEADGYRPLVRSVDKKVRGEVQSRLPFKIHFNELGDHTVYAALRGRRPLGLVHARTEEGRWGLIEVEWSLSLDLAIRSLKFHRCRSKYRGMMEHSAFVKGLIGLDVRRLSLLIDDKGGVSPKAGDFPRGAEELAATVLKSAIKTLILTDSAWRHDIERLRDLDLGLRAFPDGEAIRLLLRPKGVAPRRTTYVRGVRALLVRDGRGRRLGRVVSTEIARGAVPFVLTWIQDAEGRITQVDSGTWPDAGTRTEFKRLEGRLFAPTESPTGAAEKIAVEVATIVAELKEPGAK